MKTKHDTYTLSVSQLAYLMAEHKIYLDEAFQSNTRWVTLMNQEYMKSIIEGRAITPITLGSVDEILSSIERRFGPTHLDYKIACAFEYQNDHAKGWSKALLLSSHQPA